MRRRGSLGLFLLGWVLLGCLPSEGGTPQDPVDLSPPASSVSENNAKNSSGTIRESSKRSAISPTALSTLPEELVPDEELRAWKYVVLHHSATSSGSVAGIDEAHRQRVDSQGNPWRGIGYHFVIGNGDGMKDGEVSPTFRWKEQCDGAHAGIAEYNQMGIGICLIGNFEESQPTAAQLRSVKSLVKMLKQEFQIRSERVVSHKHVKSTDCPGANFPLAEVAKVGDDVVNSASPGNPTRRNESKFIEIVQQTP